MEDRVRSGIIGAGFIGTVHARAVKAAGGVVTAIADSNHQSAAALAAQVGASRVSHSVRELLSSDDVDLVHVCTPNHLHASLALEAIRNRKHVICEKPLATNVMDAEALRHGAAEAGVIAVVPFVYRFYPTVREARARIRRGDLGQVRLLHGHYLQDWMVLPSTSNWRVRSSEGGPSRTFADIGVHWCDLAEFLTDQRIVRISAQKLTTHRRRNGEAVDTEDVATLMFETNAGALGSVALSQVSAGRKNGLWISCDGDLATVAFDQQAPDWLWVGGLAENSLVPRGSTSADEDAKRLTRLPSGHPEGYQDCFTSLMLDTYTAIAGEVPDGLPTFSDGHRAAALTDAVMRAASESQWVEVSE